VRIDGFVCDLACTLGDAELRALVGAIAAHRRPAASAANQRVLSGRTATWRHEIPSIGPVVIKEYRRGGMLRHFRRRHYLRVGTTRPERELAILKLARDAGVNVPEPIACFSRGWLFYRGWLVTRCIQGESLAHLGSTDRGMFPLVMDEMTRQVRLLIRHRIAHVDLHPGNVIVDTNGRLYLLDFDKAVLFDGTLEELRDHYHARWTRAVDKHGLPALLSKGFREGLYEEPSPVG